MVKENEMDQTFENGRFLLGDCLERMAELPDASVDMILCDLPYGTTACAWDQVIPFDPLWREYWRVARPGAAVVLTAAQPFTSALVMSQVDRFGYSLVWDKVNRYTGALQSHKKPMRRHEDVLVFYEKQPTYNPQLREGVAYTTSRPGGHGETIGNADIGRNRPAKSDGKSAMPGSVIEVKSAFGPVKQAHPTQKPVALFEYLIRTYTDEGMTVLDNCAGSGTTAIAAERTGRKWVCIERDPEYFAKACDRVAHEVFGDLA